jgi:hypothetical protein
MSVTPLDREVFEIIWEEGQKKIARDGKKALKRTLEQEIESCEKENPTIQRLQDTYQFYLKNPTPANRAVVSKMVNYIKNPTARNMSLYKSAILSASKGIPVGA